MADSIVLNFIAAFFATAGFCILSTVPKRYILTSSLTGAFGWLVYKLLVLSGDSKIFACFLGACTVAVISEVFSRAGKEATTLFIIPGILPLVPGAGMYYTMLSVMQRDYITAAQVGFETLFMAGSIALALLIIASLVRILVVAKQQLSDFRLKRMKKREQNFVSRRPNDGS